MNYSEKKQKKKKKKIRRKETKEHTYLTMATCLHSNRRYGLISRALVVVEKIIIIIIIYV